MRMSLPRSIIRTIQRAVVEFDMLAPDDKVLVGLSGGKDSTFLLYALGVFVKHLPFPVKLCGISVDLGFKKEEEMNYDRLHEKCEELGVPFNVVRAELADDILNNAEQNPCARCSYFRRAIIHNYAKTNGYNKVAFAHHLDDAVETFLMSIIYSGQITTFMPNTYLDKTGVTVIRPLVYLRDSEIASAARKLELPVMPNPCPLDRHTKREAVKVLIRNLKKDNPNVFAHLAAAMRDGRNTQLWPCELTKEEIRAKSHEFWFGQK